jgi:3-hydroxybutyrate dehydrogenase
VHDYLDTGSAAAKERLTLLRKMYRQWPFLRALLSNMDMVLAKSDLSLGSRYAQLVPDARLRRRILAGARNRPGCQRQGRPADQRSDERGDGVGRAYQRRAHDCAPYGGRARELSWRLRIHHSRSHGMLNGKSALVTGSTSGIGLGIARALAAQGAHITLNGFGAAAEIEQLRAALAEEFGVKVGFNGADMSVPAQIREMVDAAARAHGTVDILVNNAGIQHTAPVDDFADERWDAVIAINLSSSFHAVKAVLPHMKRRGWGRIVNIASTHGLVASVEKVAYVAAKHGVLGLTKVVALETATTSITCNAICPGWVLTPLVQKQIDDLAARDLIPVSEASSRLLGAKQPSGEFATPAQIGALTVFLCSEEAAQIRGAALPVDGGWLAQ